MRDAGILTAKKIEIAMMASMMKTWGTGIIVLRFASTICANRPEIKTVVKRPAQMPVTKELITIAAASNWKIATFYRLVSPIDRSTPDSHPSSRTFWLNDTVIMKNVRVRIMTVTK